MAKLNKQLKKRVNKKQQLKREKAFVYVKAVSRWGAAAESLDSTNITLVTARHFHSLPHLNTNITTRISKL